jgi:Uma2 family endonuclease
VDEYHQLIRTGILTEADRVELLEGWIVPKMPRNPPHDTSLKLTAQTIDPQTPAGWHARWQSAITLPESEPEPDGAIVQGDIRDFANRHPSPQDIGLLIEVADTSLDRDRNRKGPLYARANIPIYWIINPIDAQVAVYSEPTGPSAAPGYRQRQDFMPGSDVPLVLAGQVVGQVAVNDLLP